MKTHTRHRWFAALIAAVAIAGLSLSSGTSVGAQSTPSTVPAATPETATPEVQPASLGPIGHQGRWLTTADGRVLMLNGTNFVDKNLFTPAGYGFEEDDAQWLAANGFDAVRLGFNAGAVMPTPGVIDTAYVDSFVETVELLEANGLLVLIDLHQDGWGPSLGSNGFPEWMTLTHGAENTGTPFPLYYLTNPAIQVAFDSFWANEKGPGDVPLQDRVATVFDVMAQRLAGSDAILGWDLLNEPWPGTNFGPCIESGPGCPAQDKASLDPYYSRMTGAIRNAGAEQLVFGEPWVLFNFGEPDTNIALPGGDANSGLSFHVYPLSDDKVPVVMDKAEAWSATTGGALLNTEFGANPDPKFTDMNIKEFDRALIPWMHWAYNENTIEDLKAPPSDHEADNVDALVRPHPLAIGGTPTRLDYDLPTRVMRFTWDTTGPDGTQFPADTETVFQVAPRTYPKGYKVLTVGATVTSEPNAASLTVVADGSTAEPKVVVYPADSPTPSLDFPEVELPATPITPGPSTDEPPAAEPSSNGNAPSDGNAPSNGKAPSDGNAPSNGKAPSAGNQPTDGNEAGAPVASTGPITAPLTPRFTG